MRPDSPLVTDLAPSPNFTDRRGKTIDALILHYTGMPTGDGALARLTDAAAGVSCHYLVWEDGRITQLVAEADRAWHAGIGVWDDDGDINSLSLGIEIVNAGHPGGCPPYPAAQIEAVAALARDVCARHVIPPYRVLGHSDVAPIRKNDPGEWFPWRTLAEAGVGAFVDVAAVRDGRATGAAPRPPCVGELQRALHAFGYGCPETGVRDPVTVGVIEAFQRHYRQSRIDGIADDETIAILEALIAIRLR